MQFHKLLLLTQQAPITVRQLIMHAFVSHVKVLIRSPSLFNSCKSLPLLAQEEINTYVKVARLHELGGEQLRQVGHIDRVLHDGQQGANFAPEFRQKVPRRVQVFEVPRPAEGAKAKKKKKNHVRV